MYTRYKKSDAFHRANAPRECGAELKSKLQAKCCRYVPTFRTKDGQWVCGKHLDAAISPECSVCYNRMTSKQRRTLPCEHTFHTKCIDRWSKMGNRTCPLCRAEFAPPPPEADPTPQADQTLVLMSIVVTELVNYGYVLPETVSAIANAYGEDWWVYVSELIAVPIYANGSAQWSVIDFDHVTAFMFTDRTIFT